MSFPDTTVPAAEGRGPGRPVVVTDQLRQLIKEVVLTESGDDYLAGGLTVADDARSA